jgi:hypothetical protein
MSIDGKYGVPTVAVHTDIFYPVTQSVVRMAGMPRMRQVYVAQPIMGKTPQQLRACIDGPDMKTGRPFMQEVVEGLTRPLDSQDVRDSSFDRTTPRLLEADTEENLAALFEENHWTDYLPIILPTEERVEAMLRQTSHARDEIIGRMRPTHFREYWAYDVEKVAVNAVMAGAKPEYFPVILAMAASGVSARGSTTSSAAAMAVVNGPIRHELNMNSGMGAMGPYNHANATIGRAWGLLSTNLQGGSTPGLTYLGSQGNNYAYTSITFAENEERSPWNPFHVQHGLKAEESAVSLFGGARATSFSLGLRERFWEKHVTNLVRGFDPHTEIVFVLDPITAQQFIDRGGFDTKEKLIEWVHKNVTMESAEFWDYQLIQNYIYPRATYGEEPFASRLAAPEGTMIPMFLEDEIHVTVVGGETNGYWRIMAAGYRGTFPVDPWR